MNSRKPGPGEAFGATRRVGGGELSDDDVEGHGLVRGPEPDGHLARSAARQSVARDAERLSGAAREGDGIGGAAGEIDDVEGHGMARGPDAEGHITAR